MMKLLSSKFHEKGGFTLLEMLVTVSIISIISGITIIGVAAIKTNLEQKELDSKAEIIYSAAQAHLLTMDASGISSVYYNEGNNILPQITIMPEKGIYTAEGQPWESIHYLSNYLTNDTSLLSIIQDACDNELYMNSWVIEVIPETSVVYSVYYAEAKGTENLGNSIDTSSMNALRLRIGRKGTHIGYYDGDEDMLPDIFVNKRHSLDSIDADVEVVNAETLTANLEFTLPQSVTDYTWIVTISDGTNTVTINKGIYFIKSGNTYNAALVLDSLESEKTRFKNLFPTLTPGNDISITLTVSTNNKYVGDGTDTAITNSLFADVKDDTANINNLRHLQNLDSGSGVKDTITKAILSSDITGFKFSSITNPSLDIFDGNNYNISSLTIDGGGLFQNFVGSEIRDLGLVNISTHGNSKDPNAGTLISSYNGTKLTLTNIQVYLTDITSTTRTLDTITTKLVKVYSEKANAGGLIGLSNGQVAIYDSSASTVINGSTSAGGLIGKSTKVVTIKNSYADNYIKSEDGSVGGLVGNNSVVITANDAYAAGFITGQNEQLYGLCNGLLTGTNVYTICTQGNSKLPQYIYKDTSNSTGTIYNAIDFITMVKNKNLPKGISQWKANFSKPYNLDGDKRKTYPFPSVLSQYGDWDTTLLDLKLDTKLVLISGVRTVWESNIITQTTSLGDILGTNNKTYKDTNIKHIPAQYQGSPYQLEGWYASKDEAGIMVIDAEGNILTDITSYVVKVGNIDTLTLYAKWSYNYKRYELVNGFHKDTDGSLSVANNTDYIIVVTNDTNIIADTDDTNHYALSRSYIAKDKTEIRSGKVKVKYDNDLKIYYIDAPTGAAEVWKVKHSPNLRDLNILSSTYDFMGGYLIYDPQEEEGVTFPNALVSRWTGKLNQSLAFVYSLDTEDSTQFSAVVNATSNLGSLSWHYNSTSQVLFFGSSTFTITQGKYLHLNNAKNINIFSRNFGNIHSHTFLFRSSIDTYKEYTFDETCTLTLYNGSEENSNSLLGQYELSGTGEVATIKDQSGATLEARVSNIRSIYDNTNGKNGDKNKELTLPFGGWVVQRDETGTNQTTTPLTTSLTFNDLKVEDLITISEQYGGELILYARFDAKNIYAAASSFIDDGQYLITYEDSVLTRMLRAEAADDYHLATKNEMSTIRSEITINNNHIFLGEDINPNLIWTAEQSGNNNFYLKAYNEQYLSFNKKYYKVYGYPGLVLSDSPSATWCFIENYKIKYGGMHNVIIGTDENGASRYLHRVANSFITHDDNLSQDIYIYRYYDTLYFYE